MFFSIAVVSVITFSMFSFKRPIFFAIVGVLLKISSEPSGPIFLLNLTNVGRDMILAVCIVKNPQKSLIIYVPM